MKTSWMLLAGIVLTLAGCAPSPLRDAEKQGHVSATVAWKNSTTAYLKIEPWFQFSTWEPPPEVLADLQVGDRMDIRWWTRLPKIELFSPRQCPEGRLVDLAPEHVPDTQPANEPTEPLGPGINEQRTIKRPDKGEK